MEMIIIKNRQTKNIKSVTWAHIGTRSCLVVVADVGDDDVENDDVTFVVGM